LDVPSVYVPAKVYEYVQVGRPILLCTTRHSPSERVLSLSGVPYRCVFTDDSAAETDRKVLEFLSLASDPAELRAEFAATFAAMPQAIELSGLIEATARMTSYPI
jgi:hypothetical protein